MALALTKYTDNYKITTNQRAKSCGNWFTSRVWVMCVRVFVAWINPPSFIVPCIYCTSRAAVSASNVHIIVEAYARRAAGELQTDRI